MLESIDIPDGLLDRQRKALVGELAELAFTLDGDRWDELTARVVGLKAGLPASQLYGLLRRARAKGLLTGRKAGETEALLTEFGDRLADLRSGLTLDDFRSPLLGYDTAHALVPFVRLATLRDYVAPFNDAQPDGIGEPA